MIINKGNGKWVLKFSDGREESFSSESDAKKREVQINYFKHMDSQHNKKKGK
jgi:hypothetical protein